MPVARDQAIALCRISSDDQLSGHSLDAQEDSVIAAALKLDVELVRMWKHVQTAKKGANASRKDLKEIMEYVKRNRRVKYLLVDRLSRLMREMMMTAKYIYDLRELGVELYVCDTSQQHLNDSTATGGLFVMLEAFKSEQENKERRDTVVSRMKARYAAGYYVSKPHAGYMKSDIAGIHVPDPSFTLLQSACRHIIYDGYNGDEAMMWLYTHGYRTTAGRRLQLNKFTEFIIDEYYCGVINVASEGWPKGVRGLHQKMLTKSEHAKLVAVLLKRNPRIRIKHNPEFPLSAMLRHHECAGQKVSLYTGYNHNRGKDNKGRQKPLRPVYACRSCKQRIHREKAHKAVEDMLSRLELKDTSKLEHTLQKVWQQHSGSNSIDAATLRRLLTDNNLKLAVATQEYLATPAGAIKTAIGVQMTSLDTDIRELEDKIANYTSNEYAAMEQFISFSLLAVKNMHALWWQSSFEERKRCEQILFSGEIYIDNSAIVHTPKLSSVYTLNKAKSDPKVASNALLVELVLKSWPQIITELRRWKDILLPQWRTSQMNRLPSRQCTAD